MLQHKILMTKIEITFHSAATLSYSPNKEVIFTVLNFIFKGSKHPAATLQIFCTAEWILQNK